MEVIFHRKVTIAGILPLPPDTGANINLTMLSSGTLVITGMDGGASRGSLTTTILQRLYIVWKPASDMRTKENVQKCL